MNGAMKVRLKPLSEGNKAIMLMSLYLVTQL